MPNPKQIPNTNFKASKQTDVVANGYARNRFDILILLFVICNFLAVVAGTAIHPRQVGGSTSHHHLTARDRGLVRANR